MEMMPAFGFAQERIQTRPSREFRGKELVSEEVGPREGYSRESCPSQGDLLLFGVYFLRRRAFNEEEEEEEEDVQQLSRAGVGTSRKSPIVFLPCMGVQFPTLAEWGLLFSRLMYHSESITRLGVASG